MNAITYLFMYFFCLFLNQVQKAKPASFCFLLTDSVCQTRHTFLKRLWLIAIKNWLVWLRKTFKCQCASNYDWSYPLMWRRPWLEVLNPVSFKRALMSIAKPDTNSPDGTDGRTGVPSWYSTEAKWLHPLSDASFRSLCSLVWFMVKMWTH